MYGVCLQLRQRAVQEGVSSQQIQEALGGPTPKKDVRILPAIQLIAPVPLALTCVDAGAADGADRGRGQSRRRARTRRCCRHSRPAAAAGPSTLFLFKVSLCLGICVAERCCLDNAGG